jgi:lysophospholipase L1-like esterase
MSQFEGITSPVHSGLLNASLVAVSISLVLLGLEGFLRISAETQQAYAVPSGLTLAPPPAPSTKEITIPPEIIAAAKVRQEVISMPESWRQAPVHVDGARRADRWQGVLEVYNEDGMRWARPFPEKRRDVYRVMIVGDSLTYGQGLSEEWRFSNLLEQWLSREFQIEVLNLGIDGLQSEDIMRIIKKYLPILTPDLVIYAVCQNDFLPSGRGQYNDNYAYPFPLPETWKTFLITNTRAGAFLSEEYDGALRRLHLRKDFFDDILTDFKGYQQRFASDVAEMNRAIKAAGLLPMIAIVVDQYPQYRGRGYKITKLAETLLARAGAEVIETEDYYRRYNQQYMYISRWEGHPNEIANYIWASMLGNELRERSDLRAFKR